MKRLVCALLLPLALAACRGDPPGDAPPIGVVPDAVPAVAVTPVAADGSEAQARAQLDVAWAACGEGGDAEAARCRDEAVMAYDSASRAAQEAVDATPPATSAVTPARPGDLAAMQVIGSRG